MTVTVLGDDDVRDHLDPATAVTAVRGALRAHHAGTLHAPPRVRAPLGDGDLVATAGRLAEQGLFGLRAYDTVVGGDQLVAVWDTATGRLDTVVHGVELGVRRTGAIGAVALDMAARPGPLRVGLVGCGAQAWAQLWAARAVRELREVVVASRRFARAEAFAARARAEWGLPVRAVAGMEEAVRGRDAVIVATSSPTPVLDVNWLAPGVHVTTLGPKSVSRHEVPAALADRADVVLTDSAAQLAGYPEPHLFAERRVTGLGAVVAGAAAGRSSPEQITVFCSVGLAGTEVAVAGALVGYLRGWRSRRKVGPPMK
jgi:ornithine cyclodeaminase